MAAQRVLPVRNNEPGRGPAVAQMVPIEALARELIKVEAIASS
jgi:hypothetical protein